MDEQESIRRRDAVAGLSLLGTLMIVLAGTIFYRIVETAPQKGPPMSRPLLVDSQKLETPSEAGGWIDPATLPPAPPLDLETDAIAAEAPSTSPTDDIQPASHSATGESRSVEADSRPQFVAPSGR